MLRYKDSVSPTPLRSICLASNEPIRETLNNNVKTFDDSEKKTDLHH